MQRTLAQDTNQHIDQSVLLQGWVHTIRSHGKVAFVDLRDRSGIVQVVFAGEIAQTAKELRDEYVIEIEGKVKKRPESMVNKDLKTGEIEVEGEKLTILGTSETPPFDIKKDTSDIEENLRAEYRYLDLRSSRLHNNIKLRSEFVRLAREYLFSQDFTEIETPLLTQSTPEGSRDFVVPSRLQPGKFYALPQSPQQYKQLLMTAGFERYFQIARAIRDEDLRADRGFEHTQIDIEMSFVQMDDVMNTVEGLITHAVEKMGYTIKEKPFPRISYADAMKKYGSDKFDMRTDEEKQKGILAYAWVINFPFFERTDSGGWTFSHNPFSLPIPEHIQWLLEGKNIDQILTTQYDLVCNGYEAGGGSIRAHKAELLHATYKIMGYSEEETEKSVGHMLKAFKFGTPPHGGIALGVERSIMNLTGEKYLREVQAFSMTGGGRTAVMQAPTPLTKKQLDELHITPKGVTLYQRVREAIESHTTEFSEYHHAPVRTSEEAAIVRNTPPHEGAKALLLIADGKPVQVVVPGNEKIDMEKMKGILKVEKLKMASIEEAQAMSGVEVGGIPPFGNLFENPVPVYVSKKLLQNSEIEFNAGDRSISIRMKAEDYKNLVKPVVGDYEIVSIKE